MGNAGKVATLTEKLATRLKNVLDTDFPNREAAAIVVDKDKDTISRYALGKSVPPFDVVIGLARYTGVSLDWLAYGKGNKYEKDNVSIKSGSTTIKIYDVSVSAGPGCFVGDEFVHSKIVLSNEFLELYGLTKDCVGVFITGDSMKPKLKNSDTVIINTAITEFEDDNVYVFSYDNHCYIKQLQKIGREIRVKSLNPDYESWTIIPEEEDSFKVIGKLALIIEKP
jgi:bacteriophage CI repressor helix-turn-helix domain|nr:MAG TPA: Repressor protein CI [Caudoviricetes sp.]